MATVTDDALIELAREIVRHAVARRAPSGLTSREAEEHRIAFVTLTDAVRTLGLEADVRAFIDAASDAERITAAQDLVNAAWVQAAQATTPAQRQAARTAVEDAIKNLVIVRFRPYG